MGMWVEGRGKGGMGGRRERIVLEGRGAKGG